MLAESNLKPWTPDAKSFVSITPELLKVKFEPTMVLEPNVQPPTVPDSAFSTPALVTLNGADANALLPRWIPTSPSATNISFPLPILIVLLAGSKVKLVAVIVLELIVNPPIAPAVAVIVPCIVTSPVLSRWNLEELISILPSEPLIYCPVLPK